MARIFTWTGRGGDGGQRLLFQQFSTTYISITSPAFAYNAAMGGYALDLGDLNAGVKINLGAAKSEIYVGFMVAVSTYAYAGHLLHFFSGATCLAELYRNYGYTPLTRIRFYRGDFATLLASGGAIDDGGTAYYVEVYYKPAVSGGRCTVKINGRTVMDYTGQTVPGTESTLDSLVFGRWAATKYTSYNINDIVVDDAAWPGVLRMAVLTPNGVGNSGQWSPSVAPLWDAVNETPPSTTEYNHVNTVDQSDTFPVSDLPAAAAAVKGVSVRVYSTKENVPTPTRVAALVRTGSTPTDYPGTGAVVGVVPIEIATYWRENPNTTIAWTPAEVNSMEIGYKSAT